MLSTPHAGDQDIIAGANRVQFEVQAEQLTARFCTCPPCRCCWSPPPMVSHSPVGALYPVGPRQCSHSLRRSIGCIGRVPFGHGLKLLARLSRLGPAIPVIPGIPAIPVSSIAELVARRWCVILRLSEVS